MMAASVRLLLLLLVLLPSLSPAQEPDSTALAQPLATLDALIKAGSYREAEDRARELLAETEAEHGAESLEAAEALDRLVESLWRGGRVADPDTRELAERAIAIKERILGPGNAAIATSLHNLSAVHWRFGEYGAALPLAEQALAIRESTLGPNHQDVAMSLNNIGLLLEQLGDYDGARGTYERALVVWETALGPDHQSAVLPLSNFAGLLRRLGDYEAARPILERALAILEDTHGQGHPEVAFALTDLTSTLFMLGEYEVAIPLAERALAILESSFGPEHLYVGACLENLALVHWGVGNYGTARAFCERVLAIKEKALGPQHWEVGNTLNNLITLLAIQGETSEALDLALRAEGIGREYLRLAARSASEREALVRATTRVSGRDFALTFAAALSDPGPLSEVWDSEIRSRAVVLDEMCRRHRSALTSDAPELAALRVELSAARTRLAELVVRGPEGAGLKDHAEECEAARREKERAERRLAADSAQFRSQLGLERAGLKEIRDALPDGCALLAFSLYPHVGLYPTDQTPLPSYMAFLLPDRAQDPMAVRLGPAASIDSLIGLWKEQAARGVDGPGSLVGKEKLYRRAGEALRQAIWDPVAERLGDARQVFIVPDGAVNLVSFGSLPLGEHGYLIEQNLRIHYLSAERDLLLSRDEWPAGGSLLALGDPDFNTPPLLALVAEAPGLDLEDEASPDVFRGQRSGRRDFAFMRFAPLPATGAELEDLASIWHATSEDLYLRGTKASEAAVKSHATGRRVLHLATHGFFLGEGDGNAEDPMLLSGLVLAGANRRDEVPPGEDDGILTAEEVSALDLRGVEWAVLSACETGVGALEAGEGVLGLRRAFQIAGAGTVIMSLWEVEDEATRGWMRALYEGRFENHLSTAEAVRQASLEVLNARRERAESTHPFFWGAFIAAGDWR